MASLARAHRGRVQLLALALVRRGRSLGAIAPRYRRTARSLAALRDPARHLGDRDGTRRPRSSDSWHRTVGGGPTPRDLLAVQLLGVAALVANVGPLLRRDRVLRRARAQYRAQLVELSAATPELVLLGSVDYRRAPRRGVGRATATRRDRARRANTISPNAVAPAMTALALGVVGGATTQRAAVDRRRGPARPRHVRVAQRRARRLRHRGERERRGRATRRARRRRHARRRRLADGLDGSSRARARSIEEGETLVRDATLVVAPGRRVALTGPSGVGKSTLLRAVAALDDVASGADHDRRRGDHATFDEAELRRRLAYVASEPGLTRGFAVDVVGLGRRRRAARTTTSRRWDSRRDPNTRWEELSRGERARIAIARAMVTSPLDLPARRADQRTRRPTRPPPCSSLLGVDRRHGDRRHARPPGDGVVRRGPRTLRRRVTPAQALRFLIPAAT